MNVDTGAMATEDSELTLNHLWQIVKQRRRTVYHSTVVALVLAAAFGICSARKYSSTGEIQLQKDSSDGLGLDAMMSGSAASASDALDANVTLQTEAKILESQTLALTVIERLHLAGEPDFVPHFNPIGWAMGLISPSGPPDPKGPAHGLSPRKRDQLVSVFKKNIKIAPVAGTRLVDISYTSTDPKLSARVVNELIDGLIDYNFQTRFSATTQTSEWLSKQLTELRTSSDDLQKKVADLQRSSGVFSFGGEDLAGKGTVYSTVLDQLQQTTISLEQAQTSRILHGAMWEASKSGNGDALAALASSGLGAGASPAVGNSLALLQGLRTQEAAQRAMITETSAKFGPAYTRLEEMQANLGSIQHSISDEQTRLGAQIKSDYQVAQQVEDHTRGVFDEQKKSAEAMNDKAIQYQLLRQEADQSRELYSRLQSRLKEAGVLEGLRTSNITVVEPGRVPSRPSSPNPMLLLIAVVVGGPFIGLGLVFTREIMDSTIHLQGATANHFGSAFLGELPLHTLKPGKHQRGSAAILNASTVSIHQPQSPYSEAVRSIRTALLQVPGGKPPQVLVITSSSAHEGKSTVASNLAVQLAQQGRRVLLVDADLRRGTLQMSDDMGEADCLSACLGNDGDVAAIRPAAFPGVDGLFLLPSGPRPRHPSEMLGSARMGTILKHWRTRYDSIILDAAPVLPVTDAVVLAPLSDQIVLIARFGVTNTADLDASYRLLQSRAPHIPIGVIVNAVPGKPSSYYRTLPAFTDSTSRKGVSHHA